MALSTVAAAPRNVESAIMSYGGGKFADAVAPLLRGDAAATADFVRAVEDAQRRQLPSHMPAPIA